MELERVNNIPLAVAVILFTVFSLSLGDALVKLSSDSFGIWQIFVVRSLIAIPCLLLFLRVRLSLCLPDALGWTILRSLLLVTMWVCYYLSLLELALSTAAATYYTLPIFITLFSAIFSGEVIRFRGWLAVGIGFVGVLLILRPDGSDFSWCVLLPLASAILYALAMILTGTKCRGENPLVLSLALNIAFVIVGFGVTLFLYVYSVQGNGFLVAPWVAMGVSQWLSMGLLTISILVGSIGAAIAYQNGPATVIGTFDFAYVGFAVIWGLVIFDEVPDNISVLGMMFIVAAGMLSLRQ